MKKQAWLTTSWDDGHPLDFRVADMLSRHGLTGTFYIPRLAPTGTMSAEQVRDLGSAFEIGSHTMNHVFLNTAVDEQARREIVDSRAWVEDTVGLPCPMFCPPGGKFTQKHIDWIRAAGYRAMRSVELMSLDRPRDLGNGLRLMPTTIHAYPQPVHAYVKNAVKRRKLANLWNFIVHGRGLDWVTLATTLINRVVHHGGVFHLWGHSWELQEEEQWERLEQVLFHLRQWRDVVPCLTNGEIIERMEQGSQDIPKNTAASAQPDRRDGVVQ